MHPIYCADPAIQTAIADALNLHGLRPDPAAVNRPPRCAACLDHQLTRIARSSAVLETVRSWVHVNEPARRLIERLVDSASESIEHDESHRRPAASSPQPLVASPPPAPPPPIIQSSRAKRQAVRA
jgi:hypothetical protein